VPGLQVLGDEILDAQLERLGRRVAENLGGGWIPQDDPARGRVRDDDRIPHGLEKATDAQILGTCGEITHEPQRGSPRLPSSIGGS
jgi:hypothetical protein